MDKLATNNMRLPCKKKFKELDGPVGVTRMEPPMANTALGVACIVNWLTITSAWVRPILVKTLVAAASPMPLEPNRAPNMSANFKFIPAACDSKEAGGGGFLSSGNNVAILFKASLTAWRVFSAMAVELKGVTVIASLLMFRMNDGRLMPKMPAPMDHGALGFGYKALNKLPSVMELNCKQKYEDAGWYGLTVNAT